MEQAVKCKTSQSVKADRVKDRDDFGLCDVYN